MKKIFILLAVSLFTTTAFAQTEKGAFRLGGSSNLSFLNSKTDGIDGSTNTLNLGLDGGYFFTDNMSVDLGVALNHSKDDWSRSTTTGVELGVRYYFPIKVFMGIGIDILNTSVKYTDWGDASGTGTGLNVSLGYAAFIGKNFAIEPAIAYRIGLTDENEGTKINAFAAQIGFSIYF